MKVAVVPLHAGNLGSLTASLRRLGHTVNIWETGSDVSGTDWVVFPGVGAMREVTADLDRRNLLEPLTRMRQDGQRFLGICLGMQLWFDEAEEGGRGLGWVSGSVPRLTAPVLPHIGWNDWQATGSTPAWLKRYEGECFYFVHSYRVAPRDARHIAGLTTYGEVFPSIVIDRGFIGTQFHPELSGEVGQALLHDLLQHVS
ncbi:MAG: imidazole glycerol phosphate synthase subunit HisH [Firmicutes bacterium]|nr:imidazole glycerol phosphate synthase subunit HisH [Bacillota bacterium]